MDGLRYAQKGTFLGQSPGASQLRCIKPSMRPASCTRSLSLSVSLSHTHTHTHLHTHAPDGANTHLKQTPHTHTVVLAKIVALA